VDLEKQTAIFNLRKAGDNALVALTSRAVESLRAVSPLDGCPFVFWNPKTETRYERINETFNRARERVGCPNLQIKDFRREAGIVIAESGQPMHVAQTQLGHSSVKTTEKYYAHFSPEFGVNRAREALEHRFGEGRTDGRQTGGERPKSPLNTVHPERAVSKVLDFQQLTKGIWRRRADLPACGGLQNFPLFFL